ncbi:MAG TPA: hypothetical protein VFY06_02190 [Verrucomicrobiae bacterium]|nr:hypothetical protein [Verrucomicrobiae bacterium]
MNAHWIVDDERKQSLIRLGIIGAVAVAVLAGAWFGRPVYRHYREKSALKQAQDYFARGDYPNASLSVREVLRLDPTNIPACRIMVGLAQLLRSPAALDWQRRIVQSDPTVENKLQLASVGLTCQDPPFPLTTQILKDLPSDATNLVDYQIVAARLALSLRRTDEAESHFAIAARLDPTNRLFALNLATIQLASTNEAQAVEARAMLKTLLTDTNLVLPALRSLVADRIAHKDFEAANAYSTQLLANAQANLGDRLQHLDILRQINHGDFTADLQALQQGATTNALAAAQISAWMRANGLVADSLRWLTNLPAGIQSQPLLRLARADAYLQETNWQALRDFAAKGDWGEMEFLRLALVSHAWSELGGEHVVADSNWGAAVNEADDRYSALTTLLNLADQWNMAPAREDLLERIYEKFPRETWAATALQQLYLTKGDTAALNQLYAKLSSRFPRNAVFKNNLAATSLLLKTNLTQALNWAQEVYASNTNNPNFASTYAYALDLQGRTNDGLAVMRKLDARLLEEPGVALYYAVLLTANGDTNEAATYLKIARTKTQWLPEEKRLLESVGGG